MSIPSELRLDCHYNWESDCSFDNTRTRSSDMERAIAAWFDDLQTNISTPLAESQVTDWLRMQARIPYASPRNALLLAAQQPGVTELRTFDGWATSPTGPSTTGLTGASAIWVWDPIIARQCPECGRGHFAHDDTPKRNSPVTCTDVSPAMWDYAVVDTSPTSLFAREQLTDTYRSKADGPIRIVPPIVADDEYQPDLSEDASKSFDPRQIPTFETPAACLDSLTAATSELPLEFEHIPPSEWDYVERTRVKSRASYTLLPRVLAVDEGNPAEQLIRILPAITQVLIAPDISHRPEIRKRNVEAQAAAYAVYLAIGYGSTLDLPLDVPPFNVKKWGHDDPPTLRERLNRIQTALVSVLDALRKV